MSGPGALVAVLLAAAHTSSAAPEAADLIGQPFRLEAWLSLLPSAGSELSLLESTFHPVILGLEESGGSSRFDPPRVSIWGDSWTSTRWRLAGIELADPMRSGAPAFHVPFSALRSLGVSSAADPANPGEAAVLLEPAPHPEGVQAQVRGGLPDAGDIVPFAVALMNAISGKHIRERDIPPSPERRSLGSLFELSLSGAHQFSTVRADLSAELSMASRRYLEHDPRTGLVIAPYAAPASRLSLFGTLEKGAGQLFFGAEWLARDGAGAELGYARPETAAERTATLFFGLRRPGLQLGLVAKTWTITPTEREFSRDLVDPDGEGLNPYYPDGRFFGFTGSLRWSSGMFLLESSSRAVLQRPETLSWTSPLTLAGLPYGSWSLRAENSAFIVGSSRLGIQDTTAWDDFTLRYAVYAFETHAFNDNGRNSLLLADLGLELELSYRLSSAVGLYANLAKTPLSFTSEQAALLDPGHLEASFRLGNGPLLDTRGGASTSLSGDASTPNVLTAAFGSRIRLGDRWQLSLEGTLKGYTNALWMSFADPGAAGSFAADGTYYLSPGAKNYLLSRSPDDPALYVGAQIQVFGANPDRWFFVLSFGAYDLVGHTGFGNGSGANDLGVISADMANPNGARNGFANLDADRAFLTKVALGLRFLERFWITTTIKHRDGRPFSAYDIRSNGTQAALLLHETRGAPLDFSRPLSGPREDFRLNVDAALRYRDQIGGTALELALVSSNLFDLGNEIAELQTVQGRQGRSAFESEIGRAVFVELSLSDRLW